MKVLLVDDKLVCSSKIILSSDPEIEVVGTGNNGEEAIELFFQHRPDLLLMDIRMEPMSGLEAGNELSVSFLMQDSLPYHLPR